MSEPDDDRSEVLEWFTQARKIPELIGKLPSGERIKGGPYRPIQLVIGFVVLIVGHLSMRWWSGLGGDGLYGVGVRYIVVIGAAAGATVAARQIPLTMINPVMVLDGAVRQSARRSAMSWGGHPVSLPRTAEQVRSPRVTLQHARPAGSGPPAAEPAADPRPAPVPAPVVEPQASSSEAKLSELLRRSNA